MPNESLKAAVSAAGLTIEQFADIVEVDPKTAQRWLAGRVPHARNQQMIARALDRAEHDLWPDDVAPPGEPSRPAAGPSAQGRMGDVVASWARVTDPGAPDLQRLIADADGPVDVLDCDLVLRDATLVTTLVDAAKAERAVRFATGRPLRELAPLIEQAGVEVRILDFSPRPELVWVGERMVATFEIPMGEGIPLVLELRRIEDEGLYDRLAGCFEQCWQRSEGPVDSREQLDEHLIDSPGIWEYTGNGDDYETAMWGADDDPDDVGDPGHDDITAQPAVEPDDDPPKRPGRRWPGSQR